MRYRLLLPLLIVAAPLAAQPQQPAEGFQPAMASPTGRFVAGSARLRYELGARPHQALARLQPQERSILMSALADGDASAFAGWARLIGNSTQFSRVAGERAASIWWNPLVDAGLAVSWQRAGADWRIVAAAPFTGEALRGAKPSAASYGQNLRSLSAASRAAVSAGRIDAILSRPAPQSEIARRMREADDSLLTVGDQRADAARTIAAHDLLIGGRPRGEGGAELTRDLIRLPVAARTLLAPRLRIREGTGEAVVWATAGAPDTLFILRYSDAAAHIPASVEIVPLIVQPGEVP